MSVAGSAAGRLYLIPSALAEAPWQHYLPPHTREVALSLDYFLAEEPKAARAELKRIGHSRPLREIRIERIPDHHDRAAIDALLAPLREGRSAGVLSEAGCPGVADPGAALVARAHELGIEVVPLVGPSSVLLALMASGLNGQRFRFHGYLPVAQAQRAARIRELERDSALSDTTEIFIETPYRNRRLLEALLAACRPDTRLAVAADLTAATQSIASARIADWRRRPPPDLARRPAVFLLMAQRI